MKILKKFQIILLLINNLLNLVFLKVVQVKLHIIPTQLSLANPAMVTTIFTTGTTR